MQANWTKWVCAGLLVFGAACGDDGGSSGKGLDDAGTGTEGDLDAGDSSDGGPTEDGGHLPSNDGGGGCAAGTQDHDGDGKCAPACAADVACGAGECNDSSGAIVCVCQPGFTGDACDTCAPGHEGDDCATCRDGYVPSTLRQGACIEDPCADVECGMHGSCAVTDDAASCGCDVGWGGDACNVCADGYEGALCDACADGYQEPNQLEFSCVADACLSTDCGNGTCAFDGQDATCKCDKGWAVGETGCDVCALGYLAKDGGCVLELPVQNSKLMLWLDAGKNVVSDKDGVYAWQSRTGTSVALQGTAASRPKVLSAGGVTFVSFDGVDDFMSIASLELDEPTYSLFVAARPSKTAGEQGLIGGVNPSKPTHHGLILRSQLNATRIQYLHRAPFALVGTAGSIAADGFPTVGLPQPFQIITAERRNLEDGLYQVIRGGDNTQTFPTDQPAFSDPMRMFVGSRTATLNRLEGDIGEIILYNGTISEAERDAVEAYLKARWKVGLVVVIPKL